MVSIILTFMAKFNWNTILIEHRLTKGRKKICRRVRVEAFEKLCHFTFHRNSIGVSFADCWMQIDRNPTLAFPNLFLFLSSLRSLSQACRDVFYPDRKRVLWTPSVRNYAPVMASPSMLSRKRGWSSWKNTSAKVRRNRSAPMESTFHRSSWWTVGNECDFQCNNKNYVLKNISWQNSDSKYRNTITKKHCYWIIILNNNCIE